MEFKKIVILKVFGLNAMYTALQFHFKMRFMFIKRDYCAFTVREVKRGGQTL